MHNFQLLFLYCQFQRENLLDFYWARCIDALFKPRFWKSHECYYICHLEPAQRVPAYHRLPGWSYQSLGFVGWGSAADYWRREPGAPYCCA